MLEKEVKRATFGLTPGMSVGVASLFGCCVTAFLAIGAPPSEVSKEAGMWLSLEFLLFPLLGAGFVLVFLAMFVAALSARAGAWLCISGLAMSSFGAIIGLGLEQRINPLSIGFLVALVLVPGLIAKGGADQVRNVRPNVDAG